MTNTKRKDKSTAQHATAEAEEKPNQPRVLHDMQEPEDRGWSGTSDRELVVPQTAEEWDRHRSKITKLYSELNLPLKEVQRRMETESNFKATKRMYTIRLKRWGICKNYRAEEKNALAAEILKAQAENRSLAGMTFNNRPIQVHRVLRHCKTVIRRRKKEKEKERVEQLVDLNTPDVGKGRRPGNEAEEASVRSGEVEGDYESKEDAGAVKQVAKISGLATDLRRVDGMKRFEKTIHSIRGQHSPCASISTSKEEVNLELILAQTKIYYEAHFRALAQQQQQSINRSSSLPADLFLRGLDSSGSLSMTIPEAHGRHFWTDTKSAIYFLKKDSDDLAWPLLNQVCKSAGEVLASNPFTFLKEVFSTISPVNVKMHAQVRYMLLGYLGQVAAVKLGRSHPIAMVLHELQLDAGCRKISEIALQFILDVYSRHLDPKHIEVFQLRRALVVLLRRDHELRAAETLAKALVESTQLNFGANAEQTCLAMTELAHVYSDMADYDQALELSQSALDRYKKALGQSFPDSRAAYAIENMAELSRFKKDQEKEMYWLRQALEAAYAVRGGSASTMFVRSKLERLLIRLEKPDEVAVIRERYPEEDSEIA